MTDRGAIARAEGYFEHARAEKRSAIPVAATKKGDHFGGNTFLEISFAHVFDQKISMLHDIPEMPYYKTEIIAMKPVVVHGDLDQIK